MSYPIPEPLERVLTPLRAARPRSVSLASILALLGPALAACVDVKGIEEQPQGLLIVPNAGSTPLRIELGERLVLRLDEPLAAGQTLDWFFEPPEAGTLVFDENESEAVFTAGAWIGEALVTAEVLAGGSFVEAGQVRLGIAPPEYEAARSFQYAGEFDYLITGSSLDFADDLLAVGHSAEREVDGERFGKFSTLARYSPGGAAAFLDLEPRSRVVATAVARPVAGSAAAGAQADVFALVAGHDAGSGQPLPAQLRRFDATWAEVPNWDPAQDSEYASALASAQGELFVVARDPGAGELELRRLGENGQELASVPLPGVTQAEHVRGLTAGPQAVYVLTDIDILGFGLDLELLEGFEAEANLPFATLQDIGGPDGKGRLLVCGAGVLHLLNAEGSEVHAVTGLDFAEGGEALFEDLAGVAADGGGIRLYDRPSVMPGQVDGYVAQVVELEAEVFPPVVSIDPPGTILNLGWTRTFTVRENGFRRAGLVLDTSVQAGGTVLDIGNGDYRYTGGGAIGTWQLALLDPADPQLRATSYVTLTAFNFGFDAPTTGPGQFVHDLRVAMASSEDGFYVAYYNEDRESDGIDHYLRYFDYEAPFELSVGESIMPFTAESPVVNVACTPDGTAYWLDESGGGHLRLRSWRPGETPCSYPLVGLDGLRYDGAEATPAIAAAAALPGSGAQASLYWVHDDGAYFLYRYDIPVGLADGTVVTPVSEVILDPAAPDEAPMDLAVGPDGVVYTRTAQSSFVGRLSVLAGGGYTFEPFWLDAGFPVQSLAVGAGDLLHVNCADRILVHNRDGVLLEELAGYLPSFEGDHGQVGFEDVRDLVVDRSRGRVRLLDRIFTDANSPQGSIAILGIEVEPR